MYNETTYSTIQHKFYENEQNRRGEARKKVKYCALKSVSQYDFFQITI
jgi:hypothetical protein